MIHPTAIIDPSAKIAQDVTVGPYSIIGPKVEIGEGTWIGSHVVIQGPTKIGQHNKIYQFSSIGEAPQDLKFKGEDTRLEIGDHNIIREFCTFNRGTMQDEAITSVGNHNLFMAYVHIAHDCRVENYTIFANNASLAGHVWVGDYATLGAFCGIFQFCRIGAHSFITGSSGIMKDVPPYFKVAGYYAKPYGLNSVGLQRRGFSEETIRILRRAYKVIYRQGLTVANAIEELKKMSDPCLEPLIQFIEASPSGIIR